MRGGTEKADLLSIAPTPFAENQMNAEADALPQPKRVVQRLGLQSRRLAAIGQKLARLSEESRQHFHQRIHYYLNFTPFKRRTHPWICRWPVTNLTPEVQNPALIRCVIRCF